MSKGRLEKSSRPFFIPFRFALDAIVISAIGANPIAFKIRQIAGAPIVGPMVVVLAVRPGR
jgi:Asp/Glu/hydantoin racemase